MWDGYGGFTRCESGRRSRSLTGAVAAAAIASAIQTALVSAKASGQLLIRFEDSLASRRAAVAATVGPPGEFARRFDVAVDIDLLRTGPRWLELTTPDGRVLEAERSVFEDRGCGDALWAGRVRGRPLETVLFTLHGDHLIGTYGEPGRFKFELTARRGAGTVTEGGPEAPGRPELRECEARPPPGAPGVRGPPLAAPGISSNSRAPAGVAARQTSDPPHRLDVLVLYNAAASDYWTVSDAAAVQAAVDYTNSVYRNGNLGATLHLAHAAPAPPELSTAARSGRDWLDPINEHAAVKLLRETHEADVVILFTHDDSSWTRCGAAYLRSKDHTAETMSPWAFGFANLACDDSNRSANSVFAHEIGHVLGGNHDPEGGAP